MFLHSTCQESLVSQAMWRAWTYFGLELLLGKFLQVVLFFWCWAAAAVAADFSWERSPQPLGFRAGNEKLSWTGYTIDWLNIVEKQPCNWSYQNVTRFRLTITYLREMLWNKIQIRHFFPFSKCHICHHFLPLFLSLLSLPFQGVVSFVRLHPGREDYHSGGWQSDHHRAEGPAGDGPLHEPPA